MSTVFFWLLVAYWSLNAVSVVALVGKPRKPIEPSTAAISVIIFGLLIASLFIWGR
jgi:hypothetical protein